MQNVAVFFGGQSVESEVSVITGVLTANSLDKLKYKPVPVYIDGDGEWFSGDYLLEPDNYESFDKKKAQRVTLVAGDNKLYQIKGKKLKEICPIYAAVNCTHGERGEDGSIAGLLSLCNIPLASPDVLPSAVSMDKAFTKIALKGLRIKALPFVTVGGLTDLADIKIDFTFPLLVKPNRGGSSVGVRRADNAKELEDAILYALRFGERAIIEPCLTDFTEINCAAYSLGEEVVVSECEKPVGRGQILTFTDKYKEGKREFPANIEAKYAKKIKEITKKVYRELGFWGIIRIDFFISGGEVYLNEINATPGSLAYYLFCARLKDFSELLSGLIEKSVKRWLKANGAERSFRSGILGAVGSKGAKRL